MFNRIDSRTLNIASSFLHSNETSNHYATLHHCFSATLLTSFSFSLQLLFNMNLLTVGVGLYSDNWTELNWSETNMLLDHIFRGLDYNTSSYSVGNVTNWICDVWEKYVLAGAARFTICV